MAVITISRQFGSHGDTVAQLLCDRLGYQYLDKNLLMGLAAQAGVAPEKVEDLSDARHRARSLMERLFSNYAAPMAVPDTCAAAAAARAEELSAATQIKHLILAAHVTRRSGQQHQAKSAILPKWKHQVFALNAVGAKRGNAQLGDHRRRKRDGSFAEPRKLYDANSIRQS